MGEMRIMGRAGDVKLEWTVTDGESTERAKKEWDKLKAAGFEFFLPVEGDAPPKRVRKWDPDRGVVIAAPGVQKPGDAKTGTRSEAMSGGPSEAEQCDELTASWWHITR